MSGAVVSATGASAVVQSSRRSRPSNGMVAPGANGFAGLDPRKLGFDPLALALRPSQSGAAADAARHGQRKRSARLVEREAELASAGMRDGDRPRQAARLSELVQGLRAAGRQGELELAGIDFGDRPAAGRLAGLVDRLAAARDQIMPVEKRLASDRRR